MEGFTKDARYDKGQVTSYKVGEEIHYGQGIRYKGIFDLQELYKIIYDWLTARGYQVHEHKYRSIALQTGGKERSFDWNAHRKGEELVMLWLNLHFQVQDLIAIEVEQNGEKRKLTKGRIFIRVSCDIEYDFAERFAYTKWGQTIVKFIANFMWAKKVETYWEDKQRFKAYELINMIKETLDFMTKGNEHYDVW